MRIAELLLQPRWGRLNWGVTKGKPPAGGAEWLRRRVRNMPVPLPVCLTALPRPHRRSGKGMTVQLWGGMPGSFS